MNTRLELEPMTAAITHHGQPRTRRAVFLDRDNTLIDDPGYLRNPEQVRLRAGAAEALTRLREAGYEIIVVTNQSGVARGLLTEEDVRAVHRRVRELLQSQAADTDAIYYCPYLDGPEAIREDYRMDSDLRKPRPGMLLLAARERGIDLPSSWMIGDSLRDMQAGKSAGCRTILLGEDLEARDAALVDFTASDLASATRLVLAADRPTTQPSPPTTTPIPIPASASPMGPAPTPPHPSPPAVAPRTVEPLEPLAAQSAPRDTLLHEILEELRAARRVRQHREFAFGHLAGSVAQALALGALGWGMFAAIDGDASSATIRLLVALVFQMMALTWFIIGRG